MTGAARWVFAFFLGMIMTFSLVGCGKQKVATDTESKKAAESETAESETAESEEEYSAMLSFESFDGGGPEFEIIIDREDIVSYKRATRYYNSDHENMTGSGYEVVFSFTGLNPGETEMTIEERSPIADNLDRKYKVTVDDDLNVTIEEVSVTEVMP